MSFEIKYSEKFFDDINKLKKSGQKKLVEKVTDFIVNCQTTPRSGLGKPEQLKFTKIETWSRKINNQHRLVYEVENDQILFLSAWGHYDDK